MTENNKIFIFELDGGSWNVMEPLLSQGRLPNFKRLMDEGVHGVLRSDTPPISPRIWTTIFTGKHSSKHGVEFFASTSSKVRQKRLWDIFSERGFRVGVFGSLVTWPPYPVNGFMIPSVFALGPQTYPEDYAVFQEVVLGERKNIHGQKRGGGFLKWASRLAERRNGLKSAGVTSGTFFHALRYLAAEKVLRYRPRDRYWRKAAIHLMMSADVFLNLYDRYRPRFATFHNHICDAVSHRYWDCFQPEHFPDLPERDIRRYGNVVPYTYILTDMILGRILSRLDAETTVMVVSDHGMKAISNVFKPYNLNFDSFLRILGIHEQVVPARFGLKSLLYFSDESRKQGVVETIRSISFKETGEKIFDIESSDSYISMSLKPEIWRRDVPDDAVLLIKGDKCHPFSEIFTRQKFKVTGIHHVEGVFIARGPGIKRGARVEGASVYDITPTVLALAGLPVAKDMDGRPLEGIMEEEALAERPVKYIDTYEDGSRKTGGEEDVDVEKIKSRLSALGYL